MLDGIQKAQIFGAGEVKTL
jgi:hypothetical protein